MNGAESLIFIDTNVLTYTVDQKEPSKRARAIALLEEMQASRKGVVSNQILAELFSATTKKLGAPLSKSQAAAVVGALAESETIKKVNYSHETVKKAAAASSQTNGSFWDALIAETMKENGIQTIYTENAKDFKKIPWIKIINPFKKIAGQSTP